jgi:hypothetical protein
VKLPYQKMMFDLRTGVLADQHNPSQIEMNDGQYAWYANLCSANRKDFRGIPIVFTDAPVIKHG